MWKKLQVYMDIPQNIKYRLDPDQKKVFDICLERYITQNIPCQMIPADTGYGKSRIGGLLAEHLHKTLGMKTMVLCPKTLKPMWSKMLEDLGVPTIMICTYDKLSGQLRTGCKHKYLTRERPPPHGTGGPTGPFKATKEWLRIVVNPGIFIICDESQAVKNVTSGRHWAFFSLVSSGVLTKQSLFKVLHLTASPIDKRENWACLYRNMCLITQRELYHMNPKEEILEYEQYGLGSLLQLSKTYNLTYTNAVVKVFGVSAKSTPDILSLLWKEIFRLRHVIPVVDPIYTHPISGRVFRRYRSNFFATLDRKGIILAMEAIADLKHALVIRGDGEINIAAAKKSFGEIQKALIKLCHSKIRTIVRLALDKLEDDKKVIICCPFLDDQEILRKKLIDYNPLVLNGTTVDRELVVRRFNRPSNTYMCLIMTPEVGGEGISLHDTDGKYPRCIFIIPTYNFLKMFQAAGRTYRRGLMSDTEVFIVYSNNAGIESILVNTLSKSEVSSSVLIPGSGRTFPGAYEFEIENDGPEHDDLRRKLNEEKQKSIEEMIKLEK